MICHPLLLHWASPSDSPIWSSEAPTLNTRLGWRSFLSLQESPGSPSILLALRPRTKRLVRLSRPLPARRREDRRDRRCRYRIGRDRRENAGTDVSNEVVRVPYSALGSTITRFRAAIFWVVIMTAPSIPDAPQPSWVLVAQWIVERVGIAVPGLRVGGIDSV